MRKNIILLGFCCLLFVFAACKPFTTPDSTDAAPTASNEDKRITIDGNKKVFHDLGVAISVPADWNHIAVSGEDGSSFFFRHPELGKDCQIVLSVTGSEYLNERTQDEYLAYLSDVAGKDATISSFTKEKINGFDCTKIVCSYTSENTEFLRTDYNYIVIGTRLYSLAITCPVLKSPLFEEVFTSALKSVEFITTE